ncbi:MAG: oligosaccharide flippase family protein [Balneola sp.]|nr:oligosaccharide flippase family protein [Balneola sp.]
MGRDKTDARKGLIWSTFGKVLNAGLKFLSVPLLLNHFGEEKYGLIALALSIDIYLKIMDLGFNTGNVRFISHWLAKGKANSIVKLVEASQLFYGIVGLINFSILVVLAFFSGQIFNLDPESSEILQKLILIISVTALFSWFFATTSHILNAYKRIDFNEKLSMVTNILIFAGVLITIGLNLSIAQYFLVYSLSIIVPIPLRILKIKTLNDSISFIPRWNKEIFLEVFSYSIGIFSMGFFQMSAQNLRPIILGIQAPITAVTEFKIIEQVAAIIIMLTSSFLSVLLPFATKYKSEGNVEAQRKIAFDVTRYLSVFIVLLVFGLISISSPLIEVYVGKKYVHLSFWLNIWALTLLGSHNAALSSLILAGSNIKKISYFTAISSTLSILIAWFLAPIYSVGGVVIAFSVYILFQMIFYYIYYIPNIMNFNSGKIFVNSFLYPVIIGTGAYFISLVISNILGFQNPYLLIMFNGTLFVALYTSMTLCTTLKLKEIKYLLVD